jgi:hypothetical protein
MQHSTGIHHLQLLPPGVLQFMKGNKQATFSPTQSHQQALLFAACHNTQVVPLQLLEASWKHINIRCCNHCGGFA